MYLAYGSLRDPVRGIYGGRAALSALELRRINTWGTTSQGPIRPKEGSVMTQPTIQKILKDQDVLPKA
jgi:hypothetical protein